MNARKLDPTHPAFYGWVETSEALPHDDGKYHVFFQQQQTVLRYYQGSWLWGDNTIMDEKYQKQVTHWRYLPDNPQRGV